MPNKTKSSPAKARLRPSDTPSSDSLIFAGAIIVVEGFQPMARFGLGFFLLFFFYKNNSLITFFLVLSRA